MNHTFSHHNYTGLVPAKGHTNPVVMTSRYRGWTVKVYYDGLIDAEKGFVLSLGYNSHEEVAEWIDSVENDILKQKAISHSVKAELIRRESEEIRGTGRAFLADLGSSAAAIQAEQRDLAASQIGTVAA